MKPTRALVIDADRGVRAMAAIAGESYGGFAVRCCGSGDEGVAAAAQWHPDVILLDAPGLQALDTFEALKARADTAWIPVIFLTTPLTPRQFAACLAQGALGAIAKPFTPRSLAEEILRLCQLRARPTACAARR
jgi:two-component system, OmpR family, response regulator